MLRSIGLAYKENLDPETDLVYDQDRAHKDEQGVYDFETSGFTFIALTGIRDVLRKEVPPAIKLC